MGFESAFLSDSAVPAWHRALLCAALAGLSHATQAAEPSGPTLLPAETPPSLTNPTAAQTSAVARQLVQSMSTAAELGNRKHRVEIETGELDPRLRLAPCQRVEPYLPPGQRPWGKVRVGLKCVSGPVPWNVYLPVTVHVWAPAVVTTGPLAAGSELRASDLTIAEVDVAERLSPTFDRPDGLVGRQVAVALPPGAAIHGDVLKLRQWFGAGDTVSVLAQGPGFNVAGEAQALSAGLEGQPVRLRAESGRILTGMPVGERRVELRP